MNNVNLIGRLTKNIEIKNTGSIDVARFNIAVDRYNNKTKEHEADFINCVAFGHNAKYLSDFCCKGEMIGLSGSIKTGSYKNKDGVTIYTTDVIADRIEKLSYKKDDKSKGQQEINMPYDLTPAPDDDMPF